jgi:hypothetical protein
MPSLCLGVQLRLALAPVVVRPLVGHPGASPACAPGVPVAPEDTCIAYSGGAWPSASRADRAGCRPSPQGWQMASRNTELARQAAGDNEQVANNLLFLSINQLKPCLARKRPCAAVSPRPPDTGRTLPGKVSARLRWRHRASDGRRPIHAEWVAAPRTAAAPAYPRPRSRPPSPSSSVPPSPAPSSAPPARPTQDEIADLVTRAQVLRLSVRR